MSGEPAHGGVAYGPVILEHYRRPRNRGPLADATASGSADNPLCGDRVRIAVRVDRGVIQAARFEAEACAICTAAASLMTEMVRGKSVAEAAAMPESDVVKALGAEIRPARQRCATLPVEALHAALSPTEAGPATQPQGQRISHGAVDSIHPERHGGA